MAHRTTILRFLLVGVGNTLVGLVSIFGAKGLLGMGDVAANAFGYCIGFFVSFTLNRAWTFQHGGSVSKSLKLFLLVQAVAYLVNLLCVVFLIELGVNSYLAQTLGIAPYTIVSYLGSRYLAFATPNSADGNAHPSGAPLGTTEKIISLEERRK